MNSMLKYVKCWVSQGHPGCWSEVTSLEARSFLRERKPFIKGDSTCVDRSLVFCLLSDWVWILEMLGEFTGCIEFWIGWEWYLFILADRVLVILEEIRCGHGRSGASLGVKSDCDKSGSLTGEGSNISWEGERMDPVDRRALDPVGDVSWVA